MVKITKKGKDITVWNNNEVITTLKFKKKTMENNFKVIVQNIENIVNDNEYVKKEFINMITKFYDYSSEIVEDYSKLLDYVIPIINNIVNDIDVSKYVDKSKKTSKSLFLDDSKIKSLLKLSYHMKLFSFLFNSTLFGDIVVKRDTFKVLVEKTKSQEIIDIIYEFIDKRTLSFKADKVMWAFLKIYSKTPEIVKMDMFNFTIEMILTIFEPDRSNIIGFIISYIDNNLSWIMRDIYDDNILLDTDLSHEEEETVDIVFKSDFIASCSYDDTIERLINYVQSWMIENKININNFEQRCLDSFYVTKFHTLFLLPLISKMTNIKLDYLLHLTKDKVNVFYLQVFLYIIFKEHLSDKYKHLLDVMLITITKADNNKVQPKLVTESILKKEFTFYNLKNKHSILIRILTEIHAIFSKKVKLTNILYSGIKSFNFGTKYIDDLADIYNHIMSDDSLLISQLFAITHDILTTEV